MSDAEERFLNALKDIGKGATTIGSALTGDFEDSGSEIEDDPGLTERVETTEEDNKPAKISSVQPTVINLFQHPDAHPLVLDIILLRKYGPEWMMWEPETLVWRIPQDFRTTDVSDLNLEKIQAVKTLHFTDSPWQDWEAFLPCCMAVNGIFPDFDVLQAPTVAQVLIAVDIFNKVRQDVPWSEELKVFLGCVWRHEAQFCPIAPAEFVEVDKSGTDIDCATIMTMWPEVRQSGHAPEEGTANAEQLRRMLEAHKFLADSRKVFERQLEATFGS